MAFLRGTSQIKATLVHRSGSMIRFRTSQLDSLPSEACQVRVRIGTHQQQIVDAWFHRNPANPYIAGPEIVAFIKSQVPRDETRAILLTEENDQLLCISDDAELDDPLAYGVNDIQSDGCFLDARYIERILNRLTEKRNLILQGPPGTGKTWLAQRLGLALIGRVVQEPQLRIVQFHPNLSYEDFVRGWRPSGEGRLYLQDGVFLQMVNAALADPDQRYVLVIEEINRGNPAQIFGELLTLLEAGKRTPHNAIQLAYPDSDGTYKPVHVPENLYVIGTMNIADRSLALVDLAFRRRFAFVDLEPCLGETWREWVVSEMNMEQSLAANIEQRMSQLNAAIADDKRLGKAFQIGHSYVTPTQSLAGRSTRDWFIDVVESEFKPLLQEYWFDDQERAEQEVLRLLEGW